MLFNSIAYAIFFLSLLLLVHVIRQKRWQHVLLIVASYFFYFYSSGWLFVLLLYSSLLDYYIGATLHKTKEVVRRRWLLAISLIGNLGLLAYFKYTNFLVQGFVDVLRMAGFDAQVSLFNIVLPVGISFFTFQSMSYTFDIYLKKLTPAKSLWHFMLYVAFFPQLVAGPIVRARDFLPQLKNKVIVTGENLKTGLTQIGFGLVKKIVIADNLALFVDATLNEKTLVATDPVGYLPIVLATIAFGIQIYCDFSGYTDIAIGSARVFGFKLPKNFDRPYLARSPSEFWRKWHISLSTWLRDYLYIPLGGNRKGKARQHVNLLVTMTLGGLWHGAGINFVIWGLYHGLLLSLDKFVGTPLRRILRGRIGTFVAIIGTQILMFAGWLVFRLQNTRVLVHAFGNLAYATKDTLGYLQDNIFYVAIMIIFFTAHIALRKHDMMAIFARWKYWIIYVFIVTLLIMVFAPVKTAEFIYFQF